MAQHQSAATAATPPPSVFGAGGEAGTASPTTTTAEAACPQDSSPKESAATRKRAKSMRLTEDRLLQQIASSGHVEKTITPEALKGSYFSLPNGRAVNANVCDRLIEAGRLRPSGDGLFGESQTYIPAVAS